MTERRGLNRSQLIATGIGIVISSIFIITLVFPRAGLSTQTVDTLDNEDTSSFQVRSALEGIENTRPYVHPTGLFQSYQPASPAWQILTSDTNFVVVGDRQVVEARFRGNQSCGVIHFIVETNAPNSIDELNNSLNTDYFNVAWGSYGAWELLNREIDGDRIVAEFSLRQPADFGTLCPEKYHARTVSWLANGLTHHVRMVVREEDKDALERLEQLLVPTLVSYPNNIATVDNAWRVQTSTDQTYFVVIPQTWGRDPLSTSDRLIYTDNIRFQLTTEKFENTPLADETAARDWVVANTPSNAEILSSRTVQQPYAIGYQFSYRFTNSEGESTSGIFVLLNDADNVLYTGDMRVADVDVDLLETSPEEIELTIDVREVANAITVMAPLS
ncbi:MAG: hypothetical protein CUN55_07175 [Phototrophicales bacterium]|nr:MAG: hypothetical protein CUN55_07175 [Phototrophicales bacterium]